VTRARRTLVAILLASSAAGLVGARTLAAFVSGTADAGNQFTSGTVYLADNDAGAAMFALSGMRPGDPPVSRCVAVSYSGTLPASVRIYGLNTAGGVAPYVNLTVTRGTLGVAPPAFPGCGTFAADATNYGGGGAGVVYSGTVAGLPGSFAAGVSDPSDCGAPPCPAETWTNGPETHAYRLTVSLQNNVAAEALTSSGVTFEWEAQNQ
jgi:hypothetical protein